MSYVISQKQTKQLSEEDQIKISQLIKLISSCKRCRDSSKQEEFIYETLPLFNEVFHSSSFQIIFDCFPDVHIFCALVSSLFVKEIRIRAIDQTSVDGSKLIAAFIEDSLSDSLESIAQSQHPQFYQIPRGNLLLLTLGKLSCCASLLECMSAAGVPSTLVKCLYIFLDLPVVVTPEAVNNRTHLQRKFSQLLQHVCLSSVAVEEIANADALRHLFSAAVDPCQLANAFWRKSSCMILTTLAQNCLTAHVAQYVHDTGCITDFVERLQQMQLPKADSLEAFISLFQILSESCSTSSQLLDDFHAAGGYNTITDYLLKYELEEDEEARVFCQRLTRLLGDLIYTGYKELHVKTSSIVEVFQLPGFRMNIPRAKGEAIRNIRAIDALQTTFLRARSTYLCIALLEQIREIYDRSLANYFLLDKHNLISSIAEDIASKPDKVQEVFFDLFATMIEKLHYAPLQEISSVALLLRNSKNPTCLQYAFSCLLRLIMAFPSMEEFYRNVGILEVTTHHLEKCTDTIFRINNQRNGPSAPPLHKPSVYESLEPFTNYAESPLVDLLITILRLLTAVVSQSAQDVLIVTNCKGVHCVLVNLLPHSALPVRVIRQALSFLYEVFVVSPQEDQLLSLLDILPSAEIPLRIEILRLLCNVLRDSHRCRTIFRKCNGSMRIIHQLVMLNGSLSPESDEGVEMRCGDVEKKRQSILLIKGVIAVLTIAMKFEPASAKHFVSELQFESLEQSIRLLGCFNKETDIFSSSTDLDSNQIPQSGTLVETTVTSNTGVHASSRDVPTLNPNLLTTFRKAFLRSSLMEQITDLSQLGDVPIALLDICLIFRYLIAMALDEFDRSSLDALQGSLDIDVKDSSGRLFKSPPSIVHTGAVLVLLRLIPAIIQLQGHSSAILTLQYFGLELLNAVVESDRSQQLLCGGGITDPGVGSMGMPRALLTNFRPALASASHPLHQPVTDLFALLAAHSLTPRDFRDFLRLSGQFCEHQQTTNGTCIKEICSSTSADSSEEPPILHLPTLPAITDLLEQIVQRQLSGASRYCTLTSATNVTCLPAFVEFNMSVEGFGCLFLPSLAPQKIVTPSGNESSGMGSSSSTCAGGVGIGERAFPPTNGISYCSWICVDDFGATSSMDVSDSSQSAHPIRLLTVFRGVQGTNEQLICLSIHLDPVSRTLIVSSRERLLPNEGLKQRLKTGSVDVSGVSGEDVHSIVFLNGCDTPWPTNVWRHVALVLARSTMARTGLCSLYLDGIFVGTQKIHFAPPGSATVSTSVCAFVGTPPCLYQPCNLRWRQGPFQLIEEPLTAGQVALIAALGPEYIGSLQAPPAPPNGQDILQPLFAEDKLSFAANGGTSVTLTITRIRRVYNPTDAALICKILHMPLRENLTPIRVLRNLAAQLGGSARSLGAVLVGYQGVRVFAPCPLGSLISAVAEPTGLLLSLVAFANTSEQLKKSLRAVFAVIGASHTTAAEVQRLHGYQLMAGILRKKSEFIDEEVVNLVIKFTFNSFEYSNLPTAKLQQPQFTLNENAFRDLLCDLQLWLRKPTCREEQSRDYALVAHLINTLVSRFSWICGSHSSTEARVMSDKLAKLISGCLFDRLIFFLVDALKDSHSTNAATVHFYDLVAACLRLFGIVLITNPVYGVLQLLSQFLIWTLPREKEDGSEEIPEETDPAIAQERHLLIYVRNQFFLLLTHLLSQPKSICTKLCDRLVFVLGFEFFHLFLIPQIHDTTAAHVLRTFCLILLTYSVPPEGTQKTQASTSSMLSMSGTAESESNEFPGVSAFRSDHLTNGWMRTSIKKGGISGNSVTSGGLPFGTARLSGSYSIDAVRAQTDNGESTGRVNGFLALSALLVNNARMPEIYAMLIQLMLGIRTPFVPSSMTTFDDLYNYLFHLISNGKTSCGLCDQTIPSTEFFLQSTNLEFKSGLVSFPTESEAASLGMEHQTMHNSNMFDVVACPEAATIIISILSGLMRPTCTPLSTEAQHLPVVMLQLFSYLYQSNFGFQTVCLAPEFLTGLIDLLVISLVSQANALNSPQKDALQICDFSWNRLDELLLSFLRTVVVDSFSLPSIAHRPVHVVDTVLEAEHSSCSSKQQHEIQTTLMRNLMEYLLAKDFLTDSCLLLPSRGYSQHVPQNVAYFACRLVDKLWQGCFLGSISEIIEFVTQLIQMIEQHMVNSLKSAGSPRHYPFIYSSTPPSQPTSSDLSLSLSRASLYRSLNRCVLFQLSRPVLKQRDQKMVISILQLLLSEEGSLNSLIFSTFNSADTEFPVCLAHLLIQHVQRNSKGLLDKQEQSEQKARVPEDRPDSAGIYRTAFDTEDFETDDEERSLSKESPERKKAEEEQDLPAQTEEFEQLAKLALKLWEHCYMWNQKVFVALLPDSALSQLSGVPSLTEWSEALEGPCIIKWTAYVDAEATGCGGIVSQNANSNSPNFSASTSQWGLLSMYGPSTIERQLESTTNRVTAASEQAAGNHSRISGRSFSHQISKKLTRMSASVLRMASNATNSSSSAMFEDSSAKFVENRKPIRHFSIIDPADVSRTRNNSGNNSVDADWVLVPRIPIGLPLLTKKSAALSTLRRISLQVKSPLTLVVEALDWSKQSQERDISFLWRQVEIEWNKMEEDLTQERSIWGPMCADDELVKWELDPTEGPCRMRKRMLPNQSFYRHYPTISKTVQSPSEGNEGQTSSIVTRRGYIAPQSFGARFRYRRRRILRGPEPKMKPQSETEAPPPDATDSVVEGAEHLTIEDIIASEDTLIRTSRLLRNSGISNISGVVSFPGTHDVSEGVEDDVGGDGQELGGSTESLDIELEEQTSPPPQTPPPTSLSSKDKLPNNPPPSSKPSEGSFTALDQLTGHIAFMRLLEPGESLSSIYRCARICGLDVHEGLLLFGRDHFYVIDGFTLMNTHEIVSIEALPQGMKHKPIVPAGSDSSSSATVPSSQTHRSSSAYASNLVSSGAVDQISGNQYFKFAYEKIREVHRRRYLLQQTALEIFNADGRNFFLVFAKDFQNKVYECFTSASSIINSNRLTSLYSARANSHLLSSLLGEKTVTQRWVRGDISNFQYLMYLNTQAGRSYNDLMQYPIFPWVLADYTSLYLDLTRPSTFRDFTRPMGAQTPNRLAQFQRRFRDWEDPSGETPPYHYGTHYSSAMIVASYLVRMEPFAQHFIKLQGGHFDLSDRMFHSVEEAWLSASQHNMADVRELIPEFFYLPDFLVNSNCFDFGCKQNGVRVDNVVLPPWAKGDPREFIRQHREALESEYVSANLHHWIDLIFGYKQRGEPAVQAANVFHHLFYEGNVDIYAIDDPVKRRAVIGFINNFGQIPRQIFRKPHPAKKMIAYQPGIQFNQNMVIAGLPGSSFQPDSRASISPASSGLFFHNLRCLKLSVGAVKELRHAVGQILQLEPGNLKGFSISNSGGNSGVGSSISTPNLGNISQASSGGFSTLILPAGGLFGLGGGIGDSGDSSGSNSSAAGPIVVVEQNMVLLPPNFTRYLAWGYPDDSFRICSLVGDRLLQVFEMINSSQVLCAAAPNSSTIVTAGMTGVVKVWQLRNPCDDQGKPFCPSEWNSTPNDNHSSNVVFGTTPSALQLSGCLYGHTDVVTCLAASDSFNLIVSGGRDCTCIVWDLRYLIFLRQLGTGYKAPVAAVCISEASGDIAVCAGAWLYLWSINGELIACLNTAPDQSNQIYCVAMSTLRDWDPGHVIITGGSDGFVRMWGLDYVWEELPDSTTSKTSSLTPTTEAFDQSTEKKWRRQLTLRAELTVHTAFDRTETAPVPLMALGISRDHRSVLVGDTKGRVFCWSVPVNGEDRGNAGVAGPELSHASVGGAFGSEESAAACAAPACQTRFSLTERKHQCRNCGKIFCSRCSRFESEIHPLRIFRPVRVCTDCYALLREQQGPTGP